jgi:hypothetical protein
MLPPLRPGNPEMVRRRDLLGKAAVCAGLPVLTLPIATASTRAQSDGNAPPPQRSVRILVPVFEGADEIGARAANILRLQISQDFQQGPGGVFGRAVLIWNDHPLPETSYRAARTAALDLGTLTDLVLWGRAFELADGVVVQCYLSLTELAERRVRQRPEIWTVTVRGPGGEPLRISRGLPERQFDFDPIILSADLIGRYRSIPALGIFSDRTYTTRIGTLGQGFLALRYETDAVYLRSNNTEGWVPLPKITDARTEVVDFTGAIIRLMRADWQGAKALLARLDDDVSLPAGIALSVELLKGLVREQTGESGLEFFAAAVERSRLSKAASEYLIMSRVADLEQSRSKAGRRREQLLAEWDRYGRTFGSTAWRRDAEPAIQAVTAT